MKSEIDQIVDASFSQLGRSVLVRLFFLIFCVFLSFALLEVGVAILASFILCFLQASTNSIMAFQHNTLMRILKNQMSESLMLTIHNSRLSGLEPYEDISGLDPYEAAEKMQSGYTSFTMPSSMKFLTRPENSLEVKSLFIEVFVISLAAVVGYYFSDNINALLDWD